MTMASGGQDNNLRPEDFEAIREAVMETSRGRWFLSEYANRLRSAESASMLDSMKRLEHAVSTNHDAIMQRLAEALASGPRPDAAPAQPQAGLAPKHMKYFKQDEEIFEPAPQAKIAMVAQQPKTEVPKGAKLVIRRTSEASATVEAAPVVSEASPDTVTPPETTVADVPVMEQALPVIEPEIAQPVEAAPPQPEAVQQPEATPKRRIVIIRHKAGDEIDVPMQQDLAEAS